MDPPAPLSPLWALGPTRALLEPLLEKLWTGRGPCGPAAHRHMHPLRDHQQPLTLESPLVHRVTEKGNTANLCCTTPPAERTKSRIRPGIQTGTPTETKTQTQTETLTGSQTDPNGDPNRDPNTDSNWDPNRDLNRNRNRDPNRYSNRDPNTDPNRDSNRDHLRNPNRDPKTDPNSHLLTWIGSCFRCWSCSLLIQLTFSDFPEILLKLRNQRKDSSSASKPSEKCLTDSYSALLVVPKI